jgi:prepilin-type processing-associated H-X9-DG protein
MLPASDSAIFEGMSNPLTVDSSRCHSVSMNVNLPSLLLVAFTGSSGTSWAASAGPRFYGDAPDAHHPWAVHDGNRPQPKVVTPGTFSSPEQPGKPPSDAIILFDGTDLSHWESAKDGGPAKWRVKDGVMQVEPSTGDLRTKDKFGDCQLHIEWAAPSEVKGDSQGRGNSGIFLMGLVEIQVLDSYNNVTYADGHAASVYSVNPPMANAVRPPGEFQVYDIVFRRPVYEDGQMLEPGYVTVFVNGVLAQDHTRLEGPTGHMGRARPGPFPSAGPLQLQDHGNTMRFRNIWYRQLAPRAIEGGTDGYLTTEATMVKRRELAAFIRQDAEHLRSANDPLPEMLRLMESLVYENQQATAQKVNEMAAQYVDGLRDLPSDQLPGKKDEVKNVSSAFKYMIKSKLLPANYEPSVALEKMIKEQGWDKKRST